MDDGDGHTRQAWMRRRGAPSIRVSLNASQLRSEDGRTTLGAIGTFRPLDMQAALRERVDELERESTVDFLAGAANRRRLDHEIEVRLEELRRYEWPFGVVLLDVDEFKAINDRHGHKAGDQVLQQMAAALQASGRPFDLVGRWGGDEFAIVTTNVSAQQLRAVASRLRRRVEQSPQLTEAAHGRVTISVGAALARQDDTPTTLVARADALLYESKRAGRNCVSVEAAV